MMKTPESTEAREQRRREFAELIKGMSEADKRSLLAVAQDLLASERAAAARSE